MLRWRRLAKILPFPSPARQLLSVSLYKPKAQHRMSETASPEREPPVRGEEEALLTASHVLNQQALRQGAPEVPNSCR